MREIVRTNDPALISFIEALMKEARIDYLVADQNMSIVDGSIGAIPRRILIVEHELERARRVLAEADLGGELSKDENRR